MSKFRLACLASSAIFLASAPYVQAQETTAAVHGTVVSGGTPAANTAVTILHTPSGTRQTTATNADGVFDARGLRVGGPYTITVGGKAYENIYLELGKTLNFDADLAQLADVEAVEVVATAANRDREQGPKTVLNRRAIEGVVSVGRDIRDLARTDILVSQDLSGGRSGANSGGISIAGSNPRFNRITVDGVSANDPFGLAQGGLTTARGPVTLDAVEQLVVAAVPTDVENGDFTGGAVNLVLRSGTNAFHGTAFVNYLNDGLVGTHLGSAKIKIPISQKNYGGFLSGPIWKDKLFFAVSYENYKTVDPTLFGAVGQGLSNNIVNLTQATVDSIINTYNNGYASDFAVGTVTATKPVTDKKYSAKIDWNITDRHRAVLTYRFAKSTSIQRTDLGSSTNTVLSTDSHWYEQLNQDEASTFELYSTWTDKLKSTFKATYREYKNGQNPPTGQNYSDIAVCSAPTSDTTTVACQSGFSQVRWGPDQFRHANALSVHETRLQGQFEYTLGQNLFKLGGQARRASPYDLFVDQSRGVYYFDSVADFQAGRASRLQYKNSVTGNANDAAFDTTYWTYSVFLQDAVDLTENFKLTAGVRYDWYNYPDKPVLNPNFLARNGYTNQSTIDGKGVAMPRFSAEWRVTPDIKITGGLGLFAGGTPDVLTGTPFYNTGYSISGVDIQRNAAGQFVEQTGAPGFTQAIGAAALNGLNTDPNFGYAIPASVRSFQQGTLTNPQFIPPTGEVFALDPKFKLPAQWKLYLSGQWNVKNWLLGADFVASQARDEITYYDSRAQILTINGVKQTLPDGRTRYDGLTGVVPGKTSANLGANRDLIITNTSKGQSWTIGVSASKRWNWGGNFAVGYSRSNSNDLGPGLRFGTTSGSLYANVPVYLDPNQAYVGRSVDEIKNRYKLQLGYSRNIWKDNETRISLFGERQSGRPFGFTMSDTVSGRSPVFGVNQTAQALYVPNFAADANPNDLQVGNVFFATQNDLNLFKGYVDRFNLPAGLLKKYSNTNRSINRLDLQVSQELPSVFEGHKFKVVFDVRNVLNLIDRDWGAVKEYSDVTTLTRVNCATGSGAAVAAGDASCANYRYSQVLSSVTETNNNALSLWYMQINFRYEF